MTREKIAFSFHSFIFAIQLRMCLDKVVSRYFRFRFPNGVMQVVKPFVQRVVPLAMSSFGGNLIQIVFWGRELP